MAPRILVIEDNSANLELVRYLLTHSGYTVLAAQDGAQGVAMARQERPELVICDLQLPNLDGYQVLAQLRGVLAAVQSTEMSEEHQNDRPVAPEITEPVRRSGVVDQRRLGERSEIHTGEPIGASHSCVSTTSPVADRRGNAYGLCNAYGKLRF